jgi:putative phosphoribosyl transferase
MTTKTASSLAEREVEIPAGQRRLRGILSIPAEATGIVIFAHGSGSGRLSPRNQYVARSLQRAGLATLLLDLLEDEESADRRKVFDVELLASRLESAAFWVKQESHAGVLKLGYLGASTGAAAALIAAARRPDEAAAVVCRGGRPDLAAEYLPLVQAPTLLIVGGDDDLVLDLNQQALSLLRCRKELVVVPGATHLFEEPGTLEQVAREAGRWFQKHLTPAVAARVARA